MAKHIKCIRCGVCCIQAPACMEGSTDDTDNGLCSHLTIHKDGYASCKEYNLVMGGGCMLRRCKEVYEYNKDQAERKLGIKLVGIVKQGE